MAPASQTRYDEAMRFLCVSLLVPFVIAAWAPALADEVADERARLASQRIQIEERLRVREEAERLSQEASEPAPPEEEASEPAIPDSQDVVIEASADRMEMSRALEQLRELGALRDAGYVTEQEFEQLKKKILDAAL